MIQFTNSISDSCARRAERGGLRCPLLNARLPGSRRPSDGLRVLSATPVAAEAFQASPRPSLAVPQAAPWRFAPGLLCALARSFPAVLRSGCYDIHNLDMYVVTDSALRSFNKLSFRRGCGDGLLLAAWERTTRRLNGEPARPRVRGLVPFFQPGSSHRVHLSFRRVARVARCRRSAARFLVSALLPGSHSFLSPVRQVRLVSPCPCAGLVRAVRP